MKKEDELLEGNYDGIEEYDNDLPRWWVQLFYLTIAFGVGYFIWYHVYPGIQNEEKLAIQMEELEKIKLANASQSSKEIKLNEEGLLQLVNSDFAKVTGKLVFEQKCAVCHGQKGEGVVGPNLTDNYWIHGGKLEQIRYIIEEGVLEKGMLAWKTMMSADEINYVTAYIHTLKGTNPTNAKAPEGNLEE